MKIERSQLLDLVRHLSHQRRNINKAWQVETSLPNSFSGFTEERARAELPKALESVSRAVTLPISPHATNTGCLAILRGIGDPRGLNGDLALARLPKHPRSNSSACVQCKYERRGQIPVRMNFP